MISSLLSHRMAADATDGEKVVFILCEWTAGTWVYFCIDRFLSGKTSTGISFAVLAIIFAVVGVKWSLIKASVGSRFATIVEGAASTPLYRRAIYAATVIAFCASLGLRIYRSIPIAVYGPFRSVYTPSVRDSIGNPKSRGELDDTPTPYQARYQYVMNLWTQNWGFYVLRDSDNSYEKRSDLSYEAKASIFPDVPKNYGQPDGSMAYLWTVDPQHWNVKTVGGKEWHCGIRKAYRQEFEKATLFGVFRGSRQEQPFGMIYVLYKDGKWGSLKTFDPKYVPVDSHSATSPADCLSDETTPVPERSGGIMKHSTTYGNGGKGVVVKGHPFSTWDGVESYGNGDTGIEINGTSPDMKNVKSHDNKGKGIQVNQWKPTRK